MGNIGIEVARAISWTEKGNSLLAGRAIDRSLELLDNTLGDERWRGSRRKEIVRAREVVCDALLGDNLYGTTPASLRKYFDSFAFAARREPNGRS